MKRALFALVLVALCLPVFGQGPAKVDAVHYRVQVSIEPENHALKGTVEIRLQISEMTRSVPLELNNRFSVGGITDKAGGRLTVRFDDSNSGRVLVSADQPFSVGEQIFRIEYEGVLERESYAFLDNARVVNGYIDDQGAYLMSSARWFPVHDPLFDPATAEVSVTVPVGFSAIVAGVPKPVETEGITETFTWEVARASGPVSLVVTRLREYAFTADQTPVHIFLPDRSEEKAAAIFQQVSRALDFFQHSLTPYPFGHLTVVQVPGDVRDEMAGPAVVYLPPDLLRGAEVPEVALARRVALQWWGLGVMPQAPTDIILADGFAYYEAAQYLESQNKDAYRDEILKLAVLALKYESRAPISNGSSLGFRTEEYESVVGGKGAWVVYMLEDLIGRDKVLAVLREFAAANMGKQATVSQFRSAVSVAGGQDLQWFFGQWVETTGIPEMEVDYTVYKLADGTFRIAGSLKQNLELFRMPLRVAVETKDNKMETTTVQMAGKTTKFEIKSPTRPGRVVLDPDQKLLRNSVDMEVAVHLSLGYELFGKNQFLEAIREFERAIKLKPRSSLAYYRLGEVFFEQANTQSAGNAFRDALNGDLQPKWVEPMSHLYLGQVFDMLGERQRALAEYQKVINAKDNTFDAVTNADKYSQEPFAKKSTVMDQPER